MGKNNLYKFLVKKSNFKIFIMAALRAICLFIALIVSFSILTGHYRFIDQENLDKNSMFIILCACLVSFLIDIFVKRKYGIVITDKNIYIHGFYKKIKLNIYDIEKVEYLKIKSKNIFYNFKTKNGCFGVSLDRKYKVLKEIKDHYIPIKKVKKKNYGLFLFLIIYFIMSLLVYMTFGLQALTFSWVGILAIVFLFNAFSSILRPINKLRHLLMGLMCVLFVHQTYSMFDNNNEKFILNVIKPYSINTKENRIESNTLCNELVQGDSAGKWAVCADFYGMKNKNNFYNLDVAISYSRYALSIANSERFKKRLNNKLLDYVKRKAKKRNTANIK